MIKPYYEEPGIAIYHGDCRDILPHLEPVDLVPTDPPYGLKFMGKDWDHGVPGIHFWQEIIRVSKPGTHLMAFGGTRTYHRLVVAIEDAGWEIRDTLMWVYGSGFPKSLDVSKAIDKAAGMGRERVLVPTKRGNLPEQAGEIALGATGMTDISEPITEAAKQWDGWGTGLKPAWEPIVLARKPLEGTVAENVLKYGTGALNIDGCRVDYQNEIDKAGATPQGICTAKSGALAGKTQHNGERSNFNRPEQKGRFPANLIHDGSDEVVGLFPNSKGQQGDLIGHKNKRKSPHGCFGEMNPAKDHLKRSDPGSAARFFKSCSFDNETKKYAPSRLIYTAKASRAERGEGNNHPTVKPIALLKYLINLGLPPSGTILDPFMGSGSTLVAAKEMGCKAIGIDKEEENCEIAVRRVMAVRRLRQEVLPLAS